ncbi:MAG: ADP-ribosylglycohydrolase family protein, partial [Kiritimatiellae bacterium]|nr:ADP-ribosylglycohydrolase family protein [Kiritimatiellia bacterium]
MDPKVLREKILGCWLGKCIGGTLGGPWEGLDGPFALDFYDPVPDRMMPNDDLDLQVVWLEKLRETDGAVSARILADAWAEHVDFHPDEYGIALRNLRRGVYPPFSGAYDNPFRDGMGCAIRTELWACLAPGDPDRAAALAEADGCVDHVGDGLDAARFIAALESLAFVENDRETLLDAALARIPRESRVALAVEETRRSWTETGDWAETRRRILAKHAPENWTDVAANLAFVVLGWLAGGGGFGESLCAAVNCGRDADCTGATLGALLGILDPAGIPEKWKAPVGRAVVLSPGIVGMHPPADIDAMTDEIISLAPRVRLLPSPAAPRAAVVAEVPLRVELVYPEGGAFVPGRVSEAVLRVGNAGAGIVPVETKLSAPRGWSVERTGNDVEHALGPGEAVEETLRVRPPEDDPASAAPRPFRSDLVVRLRSGQLRWDVAAGLPLSIPCEIDGAPAELPSHDVPLSAEGTRFAVRFVVPARGTYRVVLCAPCDVKFSVDGGARVEDSSRGVVSAIHRPTGAHGDFDLAPGAHLLEAAFGPAPQGATARLSIGEPASWRLVGNVEYAPVAARPSAGA